MDDEESDSSDSFVIAFEARHLQTLVKVSGEKGDGTVRHERETALDEAPLPCP